MFDSTFYEVFSLIFLSYRKKLTFKNLVTGVTTSPPPSHNVAILSIIFPTKKELKIPIIPFPITFIISSKRRIRIEKLKILHSVFMKLKTAIIAFPHVSEFYWQRVIGVFIFSFIAASCIGFWRRFHIENLKLTWKLYSDNQQVSLKIVSTVVPKQHFFQLSEFYLFAHFFYSTCERNIKRQYCCW